MKRRAKNRKLARGRFTALLQALRPQLTEFSSLRLALEQKEERGSADRDSRADNFE